MRRMWAPSAPLNEAAAVTMPLPLLAPAPAGSSPSPLQAACAPRPRHPHRVLPLTPVRRPAFSPARPHPPLSPCRCRTRRTGPSPAARSRRRLSYGLRRTERTAPRFTASISVVVEESRRPAVHDGTRGGVADKWLPYHLSLRTDSCRRRRGCMAEAAGHGNKCCKP